jgi:hypothetical protein
MKFAVVLLLSLSFVYPAEAQTRVDLEKEKADLLKIHEAGRRAHFNTDVNLLLEGAPDEFISVSSGKISRSTPADTRKMFESYFKDAKYFEWDDLEPPIIRVSADASMAWMIVRTKVRRTQKDSSGAEKEEKFVYAGIMTYEKRNGRWVRVANVSTFE